jgi:hypothetical protein
MIRRQLGVNTNKYLMIVTTPEERRTFGLKLIRSTHWPFSALLESVYCQEGRFVGTQWPDDAAWLPYKNGFAQPNSQDLGAIGTCERYS